MVKMYIIGKLWALKYIETNLIYKKLAINSILKNKFFVNFANLADENNDNFLVTFIFHLIVLYLNLYSSLFDPALLIHCIFPSIQYSTKILCVFYQVYNINNKQTITMIYNYGQFHSPQLNTEYRQPRVYIYVQSRQ